MGYNSKAFGKRLRELRVAQGHTQVSLGNALNISNQSISHLECGQRDPTLEFLTRLADFFHVSTDYLLYGCNLSPSEEAQIHTAVKKAIEDIKSKQGKLDT